MEFIMGAAALLLAGLVFGMLGRAAGKTERSFRDGHLCARGQIVSYLHHEDSRVPVPRVSFWDPATQRQVVNILKCKKVFQSDFPIGTQVELLYCRQKALGSYAYDVRLADKSYQPAYYRVIRVVLAIFCTIFWTTAIILIIMGITHK
ncbi:MAG: hypothetical protein FWG03_11620 [Clostridiales bacterium]|nr:hypothetical protein [Clostridiales bacterium]